MSLMRFAPLLILALGLGIVGYGVWYRSQHPARVVETGSVDVEDKRSGRRLTFETRVVEIGTLRQTEVRLPSGSWVDCGGDCRQALRRELLDVWDERMRNGN